MHCSPQPQEQASERLADRRPVVNAFGEDSLIVAADDYNPVSSRSGRLDEFTGAMVPERNRRLSPTTELRWSEHSYEAINEGHNRS